MALQFLIQQQNPGFCVLSKLHTEKKWRFCIPQLQRSQNPPILAPSGSTFLAELSGVSFCRFFRGPYLREHQGALPDSPKYEPAHFHQPEGIEECSQSKNHLQTAAKENHNCAFHAWNEAEVSENRNRNALPSPETLLTQFLPFLGFSLSAVHPLQLGLCHPQAIPHQTHQKCGSFPTIPAPFQGSLSHILPFHSQLPKVKHKLKFQTQIIPPLHSPAQHTRRC